jgi:hypothetical protein
VTRSFFVLFALFFFVTAPARADDCRDARGEPIACYVPPQPVAPAPPPPPDDAPTHRDRESGYVTIAPFLDLSDPSRVRFTPDSPSSVPEIERGSHVEGIGSSFDHAFGGFSLGVGYRPLPWLRLPEISLAFGYGNFESAGVSIVGGGQALTGTMHDCFLLRAQIAGGFDLDLDPVRLYALGHFSVGGYFANIDVGGSSIGGLGTDTYSALSLEAGWTLGMEIAIDRDVAYTLGYRHVHTGVETNTVFFGLNVRFE